jgi:hypothetical protein
VVHFAKILVKEKELFIGFPDVEYGCYWDFWHWNYRCYTLIWDWIS